MYLVQRTSSWREPWQRWHWVHRREKRSSSVFRWYICKLWQKTLQKRLSSLSLLVKKGKINNGWGQCKEAFHTVFKHANRKQVFRNAAHLLLVQFRLLLLAEITHSSCKIRQHMSSINTSLKWKSTRTHTHHSSLAQLDSRYRCSSSEQTPWGLQLWRSKQSCSECDHPLEDTRTALINAQ